MSFVRFASFLKVSSVIAALTALIMSCGCATVVDKTEIEQRANPVKEMHKELAQKEAAEENSLKWYSYEDGLVKARKEGKFVMVDFYTNWCKWCKKLDTETYTDPKVIEALNADFVPVRLDAESNKTVVYEMRQITNVELAEKYQVNSFPSLWFLDKDGNKVKLLNGYLPPQDFIRYLKYIKSGKAATMEFDEFIKNGNG